MKRTRIKYKRKPAWLIQDDDKEFIGIVYRFSEYRDEPQWAWITEPGDYWNWGHADTMRKAISSLKAFRKSYSY